MPKIIDRVYKTCSDLKNKKRKIWLDFIKILATFLVVVLHIVDYEVTQNNINIGLLFFYSDTITIFLFFMVNGYLQLRKAVYYKYI